jgi:pantothenate kinase
LKEEHERLNGPSRDELCVVATGGGAYKYYDKLKETLNVNIIREDEMECLITGQFTGLSQSSHVRSEYSTNSCHRA